MIELTRVLLLKLVVVAAEVVLSRCIALFRLASYSSCGRDSPLLCRFLLVLLQFPSILHSPDGNLSRSQSNLDLYGESDLSTEALMLFERPLSKRLSGVFNDLPNGYFVHSALGNIECNSGKIHPVFHLKHDRFPPLTMDSVAHVRKRS